MSILHQETSPIFADLILPLPLPRLLTYRIPAALNSLITVGSRVIVPLGHKKILTGLVVKCHHKQPSYPTKTIIDALDDAPIVNSIQLQLFKWIAEYYLCTVGEVMLAALPNGLRLSSQSKIQLHPELNPTVGDFTEKERLLITALQKRPELTYAEAATIVAQKNIHQLLKVLIKKRAILLFEEIKEKYVPKKVKQIRLHKTYAHNETALQELFSKLEKHDKQLDVLLKYMAQVPVHQAAPLENYFVDKQALVQANISNSSLQTLIKKNVFVEEVVIMPRFSQYADEPQTLPILNRAQNTALETIHSQFQSKETVLLHGVTASGKTEIYSHLIQEALQGGGQVLYLLPEIALTTQLVRRLRKIFGVQVGVYHSKYSDNERVEVWHNVLQGNCALVIGTRSAVFLPFTQLSLVIVDEEHETSYKQWDTVPRYHARDTALMLAKSHQAKVLLGSATPAIESYYHAQVGKYGLVTLKERFGEASLPEITLANVRIEREQKTLREGFTKVLLTALTKTLEQQGQAIIFKNRRGYAPHITCEQCAWVPMCKQCAVSLTYHQFSNRLSCHYCGYHVPLPPTCEICGSHALKNVGTGTEKIEETLQLFFPNKSIQRMDFDTTRGRHGYDKLIEALEQGETDILVGTQMITKGLDFEQVALVGVLDVDRILYFPDFRAHERCFQLLTQVSGRAGRRNQKGQVIIQTSNPTHAIFQQILQHDYEQMYRCELAERQQFLYPPYVRLVRIILKHKNKDVVHAAATSLANNLKEKLGSAVSGPQMPLIAKVKNNYLLDIWIKIRKESVQQLAATKAILRQCGERTLTERSFRSIKLIFDVDPV